MASSAYKACFALFLSLITTPSVVSAEFSSLDRQGERNHGGVRIDLGLSEKADRTLPYRLEFYGQYSFEHFGGYISFPMAFRDHDDVETNHTVCNMEIGGYYKTQIGPVDLVLRLGYSIPMVGKHQTLTTFISNEGRVTDSIAMFEHESGFRISVSSIFRIGIFYSRADVGFDALYIGEYEYEPRDELAGLFRLNLGAGVSLPWFSFAVELNNHVGLDDVKYFGDDFARALGFSIWFKPPIVQPFIALNVSLDHDDWDPVDVYTLVLGLEAVY